MGKSTLLAAFIHGERETAGGPGMIGHTLWLRCDEFEQDITFGAVGLLLDDDNKSSCSEVEAGRRLLSLLGEVQSSDQPFTADRMRWTRGRHEPGSTSALRARAQRFQGPLALGTVSPTRFE